MYHNKIEKNNKKKKKKKKKKKTKLLRMRKNKQLTDTRYNDKICYSDNLTVTKPSL